MTFRELHEEYIRTHNILTENNPVYSFIRDHEPGSGDEAAFFSYGTVAEAVGLVYTSGGDPAEEQRDFVEGMLDNCFEFLWEDCDIAVQRDAVKNGLTGIRVMKTN